MTRAGLFLFALAGCVDLSTPRAYQCDPQGLSLDEAVRQANCRSTKSSTWYCALDGFCRDVTKPSTRECEADVHCPAQHRCLPTEDSVRVLRCRPIDQEGAFRCRPDAGDSDCGPGSRCSFEGVCRPTTPQAFSCRRDAGDADCEGPWRCGLDGLCRPPIGGPNRCATDLDCDEGWRCGGERCLDPRAEQLQPLVDPQPPVKLNPLVDFFGDGGGLLLISPPSGSGDAQARLVFREGYPLYRVNQSAERMLVEPTGVTPRLRPGWKATLGPQGLVQTRGALFEVTLATDGGVTLFDAGWPISSARALAGPGLDGLFGWVIDENSRSAVALSSGDQTVFPADAGVHLMGMAAFLKPGCGPALVAWSASALYLVKPDGGFARTLSATEFERTSVDALVGDPAIMAKRAILDVRTGDGALAIVYRQATPPAPLDVDAGVVDTDSTRIAALVPSGCGLVGAVADYEACPSSLSLGTAWPTVDTAGVDVQRVCVGGALERRYSRNQFVVRPRTLSAQSTGSLAVAQQSGVLSVGPNPNGLMATAAAEPIQVVIEDALSGLTVFTDERSYSTATPLGLATTLSAREPSTLIRAHLPFGRMTTMLRNGLVLDREADGGLVVLGGHPEETLISAAMLVPPALLTATAGDALWTLTLDPAAASLLQVRARPVPGFRITSMALRAHQGGGAFEGYLITASRLFAIDAPSLNRVNVTEVALGREDPVQVWFEGARGRLLLRNGELRSLPGLLLLAPSVGREVSIEATSLCRSTVQLTSSGVYRLESPDGGTGTWHRIQGLPADAGLPFERGRLVPMDGGAVVSFPGGTAWRLPLVCQ